MVIGIYLSIITTCKWIKWPNQRTETAWMDAKIRSVYMLPTRYSLQTSRYMQSENEGMEKAIPWKWESKKAGVEILISHKVNFQTKTVIRYKGHYIMIKGSIQEEYITIVNVYVPNIGPSLYVRQMLTTIKGECDSNTIIVEDINTLLSMMDRSSRQKMNKETQTLNNTLDHMYLINIYRLFHPK